MKTLFSITTLLSITAMLHAQSGKRALGDFNGLEVNAASSVTITQADSNAISIESDDNLHLTLTKIDDGVLHIGSTGNVTCHVWAKNLKSITAKDASTVKSDNTINTSSLSIKESDASTINLSLKAGSVQAITKDASTLKLEGTADSLDVVSSDASTVKATDLKTTKATILANDAARVKVWAESKITAKASGAAVVSYKGAPTDKNVSATDDGLVKTDDGENVIKGNSDMGDESADKDDDDSSNDSTSASGFKHGFSDSYAGFGYVLGADHQGAFIKYGRSREFDFGFGGGYKFFKWNGIGADIYYKSTDFFLQQDSTKTMPNNILHNAEKVAFNNLGGLVFDRFFIGKFFLDGGFYYDWIFHSRHVTWDTYSSPNSAGASSTKVIDRNLTFAAPSDYGLQFRFGMKDGFSLYFNYRMASLIKQPSGSTTGIPELPPYVLGINIGGF